jgi:hypothetical protein
MATLQAVCVWPVRERRDAADPADPFGFVFLFLAFEDLALHPVFSGAVEVVVRQSLCGHEPSFLRLVVAAR